MSEAITGRTGGEKQGFAFFAMADRTRYIQRWSLMRNAQTENLAEHSYQTTILAHALAEIRNLYFPERGQAPDMARLLIKALYHDVSEVITGDLPTPVKYQNPEIKEAYKKIEKMAGADLLAMLPEPMQPNFADYLAEKTSEDTGCEDEIEMFVKAADKLSAYLKCVAEICQGNSEFREAAASTLDKLHEMNMPELEFFLTHFSGAFELSLDQLRRL